MSRPVTIFTGQWADLGFEEQCKLLSRIGYDGLEIATWADFDVRKAATDPAYVEEKKAMLAKYGLKTWALGSHLTGQCVGDLWDERLDGFAPGALAGKPEEIRAWAIEEMKWTARAAKAMGVGVVIEVYDDTVVIRPRNCAHRTMNRRVMIKDGKPYWEQEVR